MSKEFILVHAKMCDEDFVENVHVKDVAQYLLHLSSTGFKMGVKGDAAYSK